MYQDPLDPSPPPTKDPFESNQGLPTRLFGRDWQRITTAMPHLHLRRRNWLSLFAYPLSGGFRRWRLLPATLTPALLALEKIVLPVLGPLMAFRLFAVIEKTREA